MYTERHDFAFELELLADLHIGDGEDVVLDQLRPGAAMSAEGGRLPAVATIARDSDGLPYIPSTSLKGAVHDLVEDGLRDLLFGSPPEREGSGGRLFLWRGRCVRDTPPNLDLPHWDADKRSFINAHVAIDRGTGAAAERKLFFREYVPKGTLFRVDACWIGSRESLHQHVVPLLERMRGRFGFALGAESGAAWGRVRLRGTAIEVESRALDLDPETGRSGVRLDTSRIDIPSPKPSSVRMLTISCEGPFLLNDPVRARRLDCDFLPLQREARQPELLGTSLLGFLRARAGWVERTRLAPDWRAPKPSLPPLCRTDRMFGVTGWAKRLRLVSIELASTQADCHDYPGVQLDDFTQGTIVGALFVAQAPAQTSYRIAFELSAEHDPELCALWEALMRDIAVYGLKLGHSSGVGFGWFRCAGADEMAQHHDAGESADA